MPGVPTVYVYLYRKEAGEACVLLSALGKSLADVTPRPLVTLKTQFHVHGGPVYATIHCVQLLAKCGPTKSWATSPGRVVVSLAGGLFTSDIIVVPGVPGWRQVSALVSRLSGNEATLPPR